ncbi:MAG: BatA domain-containing protein [Planctomycetota bacterium]|nr:BatA domain-containing protein [Planctomycetota bacterium]
MNLEFLSPLGFAGGLAVLAGALFALHRLRVRHREVIVPTTLFWKQAVEDSLARKLTASFRHPRAYLFVLAILALLLLGIAGPSFQSEGDSDYVILLDGSADMARGDCLPEALALTQELLEELPRDHTTLIYSDATPSTLLAPGEANLLFGARSESLVPSSAPETITTELLRLARESRWNDRPLSAYVIGEAVLSGELRAELNQASDGRLTIQRVRANIESAPTGEPRKSNGPVSDSIEATDRKPAGPWDDSIIAFGMAPAASGEWGAIDLWIETGDESAPSIQGLEDVRFESAALKRGSGWWVRNLMLEGLPETLTVISALAGEPHAYALSLDDRAELAVPTGRGAIGVWLGADAPDAFAAAVAADPGLFAAPKGEAAVAIGSAANLAGTSNATWTLAPRSDLEASMVATSEGGSFAPIFASLDLAGIERNTGKQEANAPLDPITFAERGEAGPALWCDAALFAPPFELIESRSFPLLVGFAARWLAGTQAVVPFAMAGHALPASSSESLVNAAGQAFASAGAAAVPPAAGSYGDTVASLLSPVTSGSYYQPGVLTNQSTLPIPAVAIGDIQVGGGSALPTLLLLLALLLLAIEWHVFRTGRMP